MAWLAGMECIGNLNCWDVIDILPVLKLGRVTPLIDILGSGVRGHTREGYKVGYYGAF